MKALVEFRHETSYTGINFINNNPPLRAPSRICTKRLPPPWGFCILFVYKQFLPFWNFHYNGKNWRLTALWGLFVALKAYTFLKQIIQAWIEPKLKKPK